MNCKTLFFMLTLSLPSLRRGYADVSPEIHGTPNLTGERGSVYFNGKRQDFGTRTRDGALTYRFSEEPPTALQSLMDDKINLMEPTVQCSSNSMTLKVKKTRAPHFFVDIDDGPLIPVSQMPPSCGFSVQRSQTDVHFSTPYQGCHVSLQGQNYVLPLYLWGIPMTMTCPVLSIKPSVSCFMHGIVVNVAGVTENELKMKVSGRWMPLSAISNSCGVAVKVLAGGLTLAVSYHKNPCLQLEDEIYYIYLLLEDVEWLVTCPLITNSKRVTETTAPPSDRVQSLQFDLGPLFSTPPLNLPFPITAEQTKVPHVEAGIIVPQPRLGSPVSEYIKVSQHSSPPKTPPFVEPSKTMALPKPDMSTLQDFHQNIADAPSSLHLNTPELLEADKVKQKEIPGFPLIKEFPQQHNPIWPVSKYPPHSQLKHPLKHVIRPNVVFPKSFRSHLSRPYLDNLLQGQRSQGQHPTAAPALTTQTSATKTQRPYVYNQHHHQQHRKPAHYNSQQGLQLALPESRISHLRNTSMRSQRHPADYVPSMYPLPFTSKTRSSADSYRNDYRLPYVQFDQFG